MIRGKTFNIFFCFVLFQQVQAVNFSTICDDTIVAITANNTDRLTEFFTTANTFFGKFVSGGKVDYFAVQSDKVMLNALTEMIQNADLADVSKETKLAFYINTYNILVIQNVVMHLPLTSPLDVKGFFDAIKFSVAGESVTLNDIENKKLRPDPRVHFVLVCAAKGCPKLINEAYMPDKVQAQLTAQTKKALNDADFIRIDADAKKVFVSQIFDWYKTDFLKNNASIRDFINRYRTEIPADYSLEFYNYNWELNKK